MSNFNSREVARKIIESNIGRTFSEGDDPIGEAAAILDSALLAAHPEAGEIAIAVADAGKEAFRSALKACSGNGADLSKLIRERTLKLTSALLFAALESAKREEREGLKEIFRRRKRKRQLRKQLVGILVRSKL